MGPGEQHRGLGSVCGHSCEYLSPSHLSACLSGLEEAGGLCLHSVASGEGGEQYVC